MTDRRSYPAESSAEGMRVDAFLAAQDEELTRSAVQQLIGRGLVQCNGVPVAKSQRLRQGDLVTVEVPPPQHISVQPQDIPLDIVYEDDALLVINKPKGMVVHPAPGNPDGTLVNALLYHCAGRLSGINGEIRPGIVHRIDKDTSGLLVCAKTNPAHLGLCAQLAGHHIDRVYRAVCIGHLGAADGTVDAPVGRDPADRKKMAVGVRNGKPAVTHYRVLEQLPGFDYIECRLETGRTHQIRVHLASLHHPLAGDEVYGPKKGIEELHGQCLHACSISFVHPITGKPMHFTAPLPEYFSSFLKKLGSQLPEDIALGEQQTK